MPDPTTTDDPQARFRQAAETTIRIGVLLLVIAWCFQIVRPFITPILWGLIIAVAVGPPYRRLAAALGGRRRLAAVLFVLLAFVVFIIPAVQLSGTMVEGMRGLADAFREGRLDIPPPPENVATWPVVGQPISAFWTLAAENLQAALARLAPQIRAVGGWLVSAATGVGFAILEFVFSILIAGFVLVHGDSTRAGFHRLTRRLVGAQGEQFARLTESTVRSVAAGVVGVALIQSLLAGIGLAVAGVPGAGLWALLALFTCVIQLGPLPVLLPAAIWLFATGDPFTAIVFSAWAALITVTDNVLKPLLLGRGVNVPMLVIFVGSLGGFLSMGIIGLFLGAIVLVVSYTLLKAWLGEEGVPGALPGERTGNP